MVLFGGGGLGGGGGGFGLRGGGGVGLRGGGGVGLRGGVSGLGARERVCEGPACDALNVLVSALICPRRGNTRSFSRNFAWFLVIVSGIG